MSKGPSMNIEFCQKSVVTTQEDCVYLITGELIGFSSQQQLAVGYVIADNASQAVEEQLRVQPNLRVSGVVSLAELKKQVALLESARLGVIPVLRCGSHK